MSDRNDKFYSFDNINFISLKLNLNPYKIYKLLKGKYDIIIIGTYATSVSALSILILKLLKKEFIINADGGFIGNDGIFKERLKKYFISKANYWISSGPETNKYLENYGAINEKIFIYPFTSLHQSQILDNPPTIKEKRKLRLKYRIPSDKKIFLCVGRFYYVKGNDIIINNVCENTYSDCEFYMISGGELQKQYEETIRVNHIKNIHLIEYMDRKSLNEYFKLSDVFIMPTRGDVWGLVINEAMSNGLPILSSNKCIAGLELLNENYIFNIYNIEELTVLIKKMIKLDYSELYNIGSNNIKRISNYTIENMSKTHIDIFNNIINQKSSK
jgi:glycosyltransferase involved in cell wall biosynthesis